MDMVAPAWTAGMVIHKLRKYLFVFAGPKDPVILLFILEYSRLITYVDNIYTARFKV